ncbi:MAG: GTP-binding protein [Kiritimatiellia bacterium]|nr:GTP-binding protein [Kiritimatiellia bacterium]
MKGMPVSNVRNFAWMGHTGSGKTSLVDSLLYRFGVHDRKGTPENGTSLADYTEEEKERKITVWAKPLDGVYKSPDGTACRLVMLDTPGYADFVGQMMAAQNAADAVLIAVDAVSGIQVGSSRAWRLAEKSGKPRGIVVTGLDKENADAAAVLASLQSTWGSRCLPFSLCSPDRRQVVGLFSDAAVGWTSAEETRNAVIEAAAESEDALLEKYLSGDALSPAEITEGVRASIRAGSLFPVFFTSAKTDVGLDALCEGLAKYFPSPIDLPVTDADGKSIDPSPDAPFTGFVWRTISDPFVGHLSLVRIYGGTLKSEGEIQNSTKGLKERIGSLLDLNGKKQEPIQECLAVRL